MSYVVYRMEKDAEKGCRKIKKNKIIKNSEIPLDTLYYVLYSMTRKEVFHMDAQFRRGILDACVLAVLEQGESYGYQMVKDINEFIEITESTLYPILKRLESAQMLTVFKQEHNGRLRKYYRITDAGRDHITELMMEWEEIVRVFQYISREREQSHE